MSQIILSEAAQEDRRAITAYTVAHFGVQQARRLRDRFEAALDMLKEYPLTGQARQDLDPPDHSFRYAIVMKVFIIVYEPMDDGIRVARFLHGARNLAAELAREAGDSE